MTNGRDSAKWEPVERRKTKKRYAECKKRKSCQERVVAVGRVYRHPSMSRRAALCEVGKVWGELGLAVQALGEVFGAVVGLAVADPALQWQWVCQSCNVS